MYRLCHSEHFDPGLLRVYLDLGETLFKDIDVLGTDFTPFVEKLRDCFNPLHTTLKLSTGLSMERMWNDWRPITPSSRELFDAMIQVEVAANHFKASVWKADMSVSDLAQIWVLFLEVYGAVLTASTRPESLLKVSPNFRQ